MIHLASSDGPPNKKDALGNGAKVTSIFSGVTGELHARLDQVRADRKSLALPEHTSLDQRLGTLQAVRVTMVALVVVGAVLAPHQLAMHVGKVLPLSIAYLVISFAGQFFDNLPAARGRLKVVVGQPAPSSDGASAPLGHPRSLKRSGAPLQQMLLPVDSVYLAMLTVPSGGAQSDFLLLFAIQMVSVTLLASPRTGVRLALWNSALLVSISILQLGGVVGHLLGASKVVVPSAGAVAVRIILLWVLVLCTAFFSALSERELRRSKAQLDALTNMASLMEQAIEAGKEAAEMAAILLESVILPFSLRRAALVWEHKGELSATRFSAGDHEVTSCDVGTDAEPFDGDVARRALGGAGHALVKALPAHGDPVLAALLPEAVNVVVVPLRAGGERLGLLLGEAGPPLSKRVGRRSIDMLTRFATHASLTLTNADLKAEVARLAFFDTLTGLANRRELALCLTREVARSVRTNEPLSVAVVDIDHFKDINDTFGHLAGDEVLRGVAQAILGSVRDVDLVCRYGGEEFVVVLPSCATVSAVAVMERVRAAVAEVGRGKITQVRVSAGIATEAGEECNGERLLSRADDALYQSKRAGRDRVTISPSERSPLPVSS